MTAEEKAVWAVHFERLQRLLAEGTLVLAGPTLGTDNTGVTVFEAPDEAAARKIMNEDPVISGGFARGELRAALNLCGCAAETRGAWRSSGRRCLGRDRGRRRALIAVTVMRSGRLILADVDRTVRRGERWVGWVPTAPARPRCSRSFSTYLWPSRGRVRVLGGRRWARSTRA